MYVNTATHDTASSPIRFHTMCHIHYYFTPQQAEWHNQILFDVVFIVCSILINKKLTFFFMVQMSVFNKPCSTRVQYRMKKGFRTKITSN